MPELPTATLHTQARTGLRPWMERVLQECDHAGSDLAPDPVHDLRVALRRCRSLSDGMMAIDFDPSWRAMKKAGRKLFRALGDLRDLHVMLEWLGKLGDPDDPVARKLTEVVRAREAEARPLAAEAIAKFDRKQWRQWSQSLPRRATRIRLGSPAFENLALEKWAAAYDLHKRAMRSRSQVAFHTLRIGIKRFRYTVENFLPRQHKLWSADLKRLQDWLGEVHDLDVLWQTALQIGAFPDPGSRDLWRTRLQAERNLRLNQYRVRMVGRESLWREWRGELPRGQAIKTASLARLKASARFLDPDFAHSQRVAQLSLQLYDGLARVGLFQPEEGRDLRSALLAAALLHDVGRGTEAKDHHKETYRLICQLPTPLGWSEPDFALVAIVARYHRGALPRTGQKPLLALTLPQRRIATRLAAILRLASVLDLRHLDKSNTRRLHRAAVHLEAKAVVITVDGYSGYHQSAEKIAAARHLLELTLRKPVIVKGASPTRRKIRRPLPNDAAR